MKNICIQHFSLSGLKMKKNTSSTFLPFCFEKVKRNSLHQNEINEAGKQIILIIRRVTILVIFLVWLYPKSCEEWLDLHISIAKFV